MTEDREKHMRDIALNGIEEAARLLTRSKNVTYDEVVRAARAAQSAAEDLNKLSGYMLWQKERDLESSNAPRAPIYCVPFKDVT